MHRFTLRMYLRSILAVIVLQGLIVTNGLVNLPGVWKLFLIPNLIISWWLWQIYSTWTKDVKAGRRDPNWTPFAQS